MPLPASQLGQGERVVVETREHWKHLLGAMGIMLLAIAGLVLVLWLSPDQGFFSWLKTLGWVAFALAFVIFGFWPWLSWRMREYTLTNERLATREGVIRRRGRDIPLYRVNDVAYDQGLIDRMAQCGTLRVSAASEEGIVILKDIPNVNQFVLTMNALIKDARQANGDR